MGRCCGVNKCSRCHGKGNLSTSGSRAVAVPDRKVLHMTFQVASRRRSTEGLTPTASHCPYAGINEKQQRTRVTVDWSDCQIGGDETYTQVGEDRCIHDDQAIRKRQCHFCTRVRRIVIEWSYI